MQIQTSGHVAQHFGLFALDFSKAAAFHPHEDGSCARQFAQLHDVSRHKTLVLSAPFRTAWRVAVPFTGQRIGWI